MSGYWLNNIWTKITNWEYWPTWLFSIPIFFMYLIQGVRNFNLLFFSRVNPTILTGGFFSEEKWPIYQMFPSEYIPNGTLISPNTPIEGILQTLEKQKLQLPLLVKPNIGERGMGIEKITSFELLQLYHARAQFAYIIQEYVAFDKEMSVLVYRNPDEKTVHVTSVCLKEKLTLVGDGHSTLRKLALSHYRSRVQWSRLSRNFNADTVLETDEKLVLEPIGNHCRGTTFKNGNYLIDERFQAAMHTLFHSMTGQVYYGRFDIMYTTLEDLRVLKHFKVVEFNGVGSEPAHIYHPGFSLLKAYSCMWQHIKILGDIALAQKIKGVPAMTWHSFFGALKLYRNNRKLVNAMNRN